MALRAYFDDSGQTANPGETACVVGGFIATVDEWDRLEPEWFEVVSRYGVSEFKASALTCSDHEYTGWDEDKRRAFLQDLVKGLEKHLHNPSKPLAALLPLSQFTNLSNELQTQWGGDPYFVCLESVLILAAKHAYELYDSREPLHIVCDEETDEFRKIAERVYFACKRLLPPEMGETLSSFGFGESHKVAGLQVADFVAYYALQHRRDMIEGKHDLVDKPWWPVGQLFSKFIPDWEFFNTHLWQVAPLKDYSI